MSRRKEQQPRSIIEAKHARNWIYRRFGGVDEAPPKIPTFEDRLSEFGDDPRVMATEAAMRAHGFTMEPNIKYRV